MNWQYIPTFPSFPGLIIVEDFSPEEIDYFEDYYDYYETQDYEALDYDKDPDEPSEGRFTRVELTN